MAAGGFVAGRGAKGWFASAVGRRIVPRSVSNQIRVIGLLVFREARTSFAESPFRAVFELIEPLLFIFIFYVIHEFLFKGVRYGTSSLLFFSTGFIPFFAFLNISTGSRGSAKDARSLRNFPIVTPLDLVIARAVFEILAAAPIFALLFYGMWCYGITEARPFAPDRVAGSLAVICVLGLGVGLFNAGIGTVIPNWKIIYSFAGRLFMLTSGVHRVPEYLPEYFRQYMVWNPMMHGVEWFRSGFYQLYPTYSLDLVYLFKWAGITFLLGLAFERVARTRFYVSKKSKG